MTPPLDTGTDPRPAVSSYRRRKHDAARAMYGDGRQPLADEVARFLLRAGYGQDFSYWETAGARTEGNKVVAFREGPIRPPVEVLEAMVRIGASDPEFDYISHDGEEGVYYVLSEEIGDWR